MAGARRGTRHPELASGCCSRTAAGRASPVGQVSRQADSGGQSETAGWNQPKKLGILVPKSRSFLGSDEGGAWRALAAPRVAKSLRRAAVRRPLPGRLAGRPGLTPGGFWRPIRASRMVPDPRSWGFRVPKSWSFLGSDEGGAWRVLAAPRATQSLRRGAVRASLSGAPRRPRHLAPASPKRADQADRAMRLKPEAWRQKPGRLPFPALDR